LISQEREGREGGVGREGEGGEGGKGGKKGNLFFSSKITSSRGFYHEVDLNHGFISYTPGLFISYFLFRPHLYKQKGTLPFKN
jgi:hypothetical protein